MDEKSETIENAIQIIQAIGSTWPFLLVLFFIIVIILKWKTIWIRIGSFNNIKLKGAGAEIELSDKKAEREPELKTAEKPKKLEEKIEEKLRDNPESLFNVYLNYRSGEIQKAQEVFDSVQNKTTNPDDKIDNELVKFRYQFVAGLANAQIDLLEFEKTIDAKNLKLKARAAYFISLNYKYAGDFESAISFLEKFDKSGLDTGLYLDLLFLEVECLSAIEKYDKAISILINSVRNIKEPENKFSVYKTIASTYNEKKDYFLRALALEMALKFKPNDAETQFSLAYAYSENEDQLLTLFNYDKLLKLSSHHSYGLNNLGVILNQLELPHSAIESYKKSIEQNNSLAASNLSHLFMDAGFYDEANTQIELGEKMEDVSKNIPEAKTKLNDLIEKEDQIKNDLLKVGRVKRDFNSKMAEFCFLTEIDAKNLVGEYLLNSKTQVQLTIQDFGFHLKWKEDGPNDQELNHVIKFNFSKGRIGWARYSQPYYFNGLRSLAGIENKPILMHHEYEGNFYYDSKEFKVLLFKKEFKHDFKEFSITKLD
ncbi:MAG: hypothetical protein HWE07_05600 [Cytophagia bacterium]|nr:hypothetical protein [Cytophagia bacterium]